MIVVRTVLQGKFGTGGQIAKEMISSTTELLKDIPGAKGMRVLTDLSGTFDTVVLEIQAESMADWEQARAAVFSHPRFQQSMATTYEMTLSGRQEFYTIEGEG